MILRFAATVIGKIFDTVENVGSFCLDSALKAPNKVISTADSLGKKIEKAAIDISHKIDKLIEE